MSETADTSKIKILVSDDVSETGLEPLRAAGFQVDKKTKLPVNELAALLADYEGLIVRSETKVTPELLETAKNLRAIGRAGVGVDNINVKEATARGIVVMNAPDGNTQTTAEHTVALLCALARHVPQGHESLKAGKWERKKYVGVELRGKTLGVVGLGRIGRVVAQRARGFEMRVVAYDPFVTNEAAQALEIELAALEDVFKQADFLTVHTPLTVETRGIVGAQAFELMKDGVRVINCARGGLIDEAALVEAINSGKVAGAALDVFEQEPPPADHPLLQLEQVIVTPHLGASTFEAQESVAVTVAEQLRDFFSTGSLRGAVNMPNVSQNELRKLAPYQELAARLGRFHAQLLTNESVRAVEIEYAGDMADVDAAPVTRAFLTGLLRDVSERVNQINAFHIAEERGINVNTSYKRAGNSGVSEDVATPTLRTRVLTDGENTYTLGGALFGSASEGRITAFNDFRLEAVPHGQLLVVRNKDVPGVIGRVGTILGEHSVNIGSFSLGRNERGGEALALIDVDQPLENELIEEVAAVQSVLFARQIKLD